MIATPFYDPNLTYEQNYSDGPFGDFALTPGAPSTRPTDERLAQSHLFGIGVTTPFGIPAGPLVNSKFTTAAFRHGFDLCVYKTVRSREYASNPFPNVLAVHVDGDLTMERAAHPLVADTNYTSPLSISNSFGVPSQSPDVWQPDMAEAVRAAGSGQILVGSFQGTRDPGATQTEYVADHVRAARLVVETGANVLEMNLSCPNEGKASLLCFDIESVRTITEAVKDAIGELPLVLKIAYFSDDEQLERLVRAVAGTAQGISAINTIPAELVTKDGRQALPGAGRLRSGVCGSAIRWAGLEMTGRLSALRDRLDVDFAIVGVGGVTTADDYSQYRAAGADAVLSATGAMWNPGLAREIAAA